MSEATLGERVAWLEAQLGVAMREHAALRRAVLLLQTRVDCLDESLLTPAQIGQVADDAVTVPGVRAVLHRYLADTD